MDKRINLKAFDFDNATYKLYIAKLYSEHSCNNYHSERYFIACNDYRDNIEKEEKGNIISITLCYNGTYTIYFELCNKNDIRTKFVASKQLVYKHFKTTNRYSSKTFNELIETLKVNFENFINCFCEMNKGVEIIEENN